MPSFISRHTSSLVVVSVALCIITGSLLLFFFNTMTQPCLYVDALLTASSAFCCVGVLPISFVTLTTLGKIILLVLIQIGSIGVLTLFMLFLKLFSQSGVGWYSLAKDLSDIIERRFFTRFFLVSLLYMFCAEILGALSFYFFVMKEKSFFDAFFYAADCFCNAGFFASNPILAYYSNNHLFYLIGALMMIMGGMGFLCAFELLNKYSTNVQGASNISFTIRFGFWVYCITMILAWILFFITCSSSYSYLELIKALFSAISFRACGVNPYIHYTPIFVFLASAYSLCGTLPFATGGGLKSSIVGIFFITLYSLIMNVQNIVIFGKQILPIYLLQAHLYIVYLFELSTIAAIVIQYISNYAYEFGTLICYVISIFTGTGISWINIALFSTGIKYIFIAIIFIGKIGGLVLHVGLFTPIKGANIAQKPDAKIIMF